MSDRPTPPEGVWLACDDLQTDPAGGRQHELRLVRRLATNEVDEANAAAQFLLGLTDGPYTAVTNAIDGFFAERERALDSLASGSPPSNSELRERFSDTLARFRVFLNRTESDLVRRYGKGSAQHKAFKNATATEYDASFAYRLMYNLRNESDHVQGVVGVSHSSSIQPDGTSERRVTVWVLDKVLDTGDWQPRLKRDLLSAPRPTNAEPLLAYLREAVSRILGRTLLGQSHEISAACATIRALATEAECGPHPIMVELVPTEGGRTELRMTLLGLPLNACDVLEVALTEANRYTWSRSSVPLDDSTFATERVSDVGQFVGELRGV